jgi:hypothetical protein
MSSYLPTSSAREVPAGDLPSARPGDEDEMEQSFQWHTVDKK